MNIFPYILTLITQKSRYKPEIIWSSNSWVHNLFRFYEMIFWRREGIRAESGSWTNGNKIRVELYSFESVLAYIETLVRNFLEINWLQIKVINFQFAFPVNTLEIQIPWISFAIAFDATTSATSGTTGPLSFSHTCTGSNILLAIGPGNEGGTNPICSAVTYNSVSATKAQSAQGAGSVSGFVESSVWLLGNASTGSNTVSVTFTGTTFCQAGVVSYSGAQSGNTKDASNSANGSSTGAKTVSVTTVADNCWVFSTGYVRGTSPSWATPTQTSRWSASVNGEANRQVGQDNNAAKTPAGAVSSGWTVAGSGSQFCWAITAASFAPAASTANSNFLIFM